MKPILHGPTGSIRWFPWLCLAALLFSLSSPRGWSHGAVHLQILELTKQIQENPKQSDLYLRRGELYRLHQLWDPALADFEVVRSLSTNQLELDFIIGRLYLEAGWPASARTVLARFLRARPDHYEGHLLRARSLVQLNRPLEAVADYSEAIAILDRPSPGYYVERARALTASGPDHIDQALQGLDEGMARLGPLVTLQLPAIELELNRQAYDEALRRLEVIAAQSPRKETWLKRRGEILLQARRPAEARQAFAEALKALQTLPAARRYVPAMIELEKELQTQLELLAVSPAQEIQNSN